MDDKKKLYLGLDTASDTTSVALFADDKTYAYREETLSRGQGEHLMALIQQVFDTLSKKPKDLTHIVVCVGPGSFTGVRIGLATARGLGLALRIPVLGISNFAATAHTIAHPVKVILDSKRCDYFVQDFGADGCPLNEPMIQTQEQLEALPSFIATGNALSLLKENGFSVQSVFPTQPLALAAIHYALQHPQQILQPHPLYLRDADVTV